MKRMNEIQILPPDKEGNPYSKDSESTGTNSTNKDAWVYGVAASIIGVLLEDSLDFAPHTEEQEDRKIKAYAEAFIAQNETVLGEKIDGPRFRKALSLCKGKFKKFPSARDIIDLLPRRPERLAIEDKVDPQRRKELKEMHIGKIHQMFEDVPGCDDIIKANEEAGLDS